MIYTLTFGNYTFPNQTFEVEGLPLQNDISSQRIPRKHGSVIQSPYLRERKISVRGIIHNNSLEDSNNELMDLQEALFAGEENFQYRSDRYIKCYVNKLDVDFEKGSDKRVINVKIDLIAQTPFAFSSGASYSDVQSISGTTDTYSIVNGGNVFSEPIFKIYASGGTITDSIRITNLSDDEKFLRYRGTVNNGETLEIDSENLTVLNNGVDGISDFEGDFLNLLGGQTNNFQFVGMTCTLTTEWRYRWY